MSYSISGRSTIARPRSSGPGAPSASPSGSITGKSAIARPCPDGPGMPSSDRTGYSITGASVWRSPCDEEGGDLCGITDTFTRTLGATEFPFDDWLVWGLSDSGDQWQLRDWGYVDGSRGVLVNNGGDRYNYWADLFFPARDIHAFSVDLYAPPHAPPDDPEFYSNLVDLSATLAGDDGSVGLTLTSYAEEVDGPGLTFLYSWGAESVEGTIPFALDWGINYRFSVQIVDGVVRGRVYPVGDTPPDWQFSYSITEPSFHGGQFTVASGNPNNRVLVYVDNLDIEGVNRCICIFDTFTRTVASGWGTGDFGHTWVAGDMGGVQLSVDGESARSVYPQGAIGLAPYRTLYTSSGPWQQPSFTLTQRFNLTLHDRVLSSGYSMVNTVTGDELMVLVLPRFDQLALQNEYALSTYGDVDFTFADGWHYFKWEVSPTQTRAKVWAEGSAEPDWMVTIPAVSIAPDRLYADTQGSYHTSGGDAVYEIDFIAICT